MEIEDHCAQLSGINSPCEITAVDLNLEKQQVDINIEHAIIKVYVLNAPQFVKSMMNESNVRGILIWNMNEAAIVMNYK